MVSKVNGHSLAALATDMENQVKTTFLGRHVSWIKNEQGKAKTLLAVIEAVVLCLTVVGIYTVYKANSISKSLNNY